MGKHVTMACGWGCGEELTARGMREHFKTCPKRPVGGLPLVAVAKAKDSVKKAELDRGAGITVDYEHPDW